MEYADGSKEEVRLPAEIWRRNARRVKKLMVSEKELLSIVIDPMQETADADIENNYYPRRIIPSRIESFKSEGGGSLIGRDIMQDIKTELKTDDDDEPDRLSLEPTVLTMRERPRAALLMAYWLLLCCLSVPSLVIAHEQKTAVTRISVQR